MTTWREDFAAWQELYDSFEAYSLNKLKEKFGEKEISNNPPFALQVVESPLSTEDRSFLDKEVQAFWDRKSEEEGWKNRLLYGNFGIQNVSTQEGNVLVEAWPTDYAASRFKNRADTPAEWERINSTHKEYLKQLQFPGIIAITKLAGENLYLFGSRIDKGVHGPRRRDELLEAPQGLIPRSDVNNPVKYQIETLLKDEANTPSSSILRTNLKGYHQSLKYGDTAFIFEVEVSPEAEWHALRHPERGGHYARQWLSTERINAMPANHINPAVYSALKLAGVI